MEREMPGRAEGEAGDGHYAHAVFALGHFMFYFYIKIN
jgi:hypothetical protein